jgi:DNA-directed RNA polymerase subunit RPC12/RpoP
MSIQFRCTSCQQPIEVDDEHAGQHAACPYCRTVITVPAQSTLESGGVIQARPTGEELPGTPEGMDPVQAPAGPPRVVQNTTYARQFGTIGLVCAGAGAVLLLVGFVMFSMIGMRVQQVTGTTMPSDPEALETLQKAMMADPLTPWGYGTSCIGILLVLAAVVAGGVSVNYQRQNNWRGLLSLLVGGLAILGLMCLMGFSMLFTFL